MPVLPLPTPTDATSLLAHYLGIPAVLVILLLSLQAAIEWAKVARGLPMIAAKATTAVDRAASYASEFQAPRAVKLAVVQTLFVSSGFVLAQLMQAIMGLDYVTADGHTRADSGPVTTNQVWRAILSFRFPHTVTILIVLLVVVVLWVIDEVSQTWWAVVPSGAVVITSVLPTLICFIMGLLSIFGALVGALVDTGDQGFSDWATVRGYAALGICGAVIWPATLVAAGYLYLGDRDK